MALVTEDQVELQSIEWFKGLGYDYKNGYDIAPDELWRVESSDNVSGSGAAGEYRDAAGTGCLR